MYSKRALANAAQINPITKVLQVLERRLVLHALPESCVSEGMPAFLIAPSPNRMTEPLPGIFNSEIQPRTVDIRRRDFDAQVARFGKVAAHFLGIVPLHTEHGREIFDRVMRLQESRLAGNLGIVSGMSFVEAVAGKELDVAPDGVAHFAAEAAGHGARR